MKIIKKLLSILLSVLTIAAWAGCANPDLGAPIGDLPGTGGGTSDDATDTYTVTAGYDYGMHRPGLATMLYSSSTPFFTLPEGFGVSVAGDEFTITYTGELLIQETYPSTVVITGGEIIGVTAEPAVIYRVRYNVKDKRLTVFDENGDAMKIDYLNYPQYYIIDGEGRFAELSTLTEDTILYGSVSSTDQIHATVQISFSGLYLENPRGE